MPRWIAVGLLLAAPSLGYGAELPIVAPQPMEDVPTPTQPVAPTSPVPSHPPAAGAWAVSCQPATACADPCATVRVKKPGVLAGLKNWLCGTTPVEACGATCPTPTVRVVVHEPCPVPVACPTSHPKPLIPKLLPTRPTVECPPIDAAPAKRFACVGTACEKVKALLCWKPCNEQLLPVLRPAPYHAPAMAYVGPSREPTPGLPCGTCKKSAKAKCETGACPTAVETKAVGPVVGSRPHPVMGGWTPTYANGPTAATGVVPAKAVESANPLARPFTMP